MIKNQGGFGTTIVIVLVVWFFAMLAIGFFVLGKNNGKVANYQECVDAKDSVLLETSPQQCMLGTQRFTKPN